MDVKWGLDTASGEVQFTLTKAALGHKKTLQKQKLLLAELADIPTLKWD